MKSTILSRRQPQPAIMPFTTILLLAAVVAAQNSGSTAQGSSTRQQSSAAARTSASSAQRTQITDLPDISATTSSASVSSVDFTSAPSLSSTANQFILTGNLPTIAGVGIPTMVIPYTADAPYMRKSSLPEGTVFIIVGAILGFLGVCILAWRGMVAWSLHRSVQKAARAQYSTNNDSKTLLTNTRKSGVYGMSTLAASAMSVDKPSGLKSIPGGRLSKTGAAANNGARRQSSLFFSPTAGAGQNSGMGTPGNRSSNFLPAGYYSTPSASAPAQGASSTHLGGGGGASTLAQLNPLGPARAGYAPQRNFGPSPPESPALRPRPSGESMGRHFNTTPLSIYQQQPQGRGHATSYSQGGSSSQLNMHAPGGVVGGGRAPSANLEELFDSKGQPRGRY